MFFIVILLIVFLVGFGLYMIAIDNTEDDINIKFRNFVLWYEINPNGWNLMNYEVGKKTKGGSIIWCRFGFFDLVRYIIWKRWLDRRKKKEEKCKKLKKVLEQVQEDIDTFKEQGVQP